MIGTILGGETSNDSVIGRSDRSFGGATSVSLWLIDWGGRAMGCGAGDSGRVAGGGGASTMKTGSGVTTTANGGVDSFTGTGVGGVARGGAD